MRKFVKVKEVWEARQMQSQGSDVFEVETIVLESVPALRIYHSDQLMKRIMHISVSEYAICIWQKGMPVREMLCRIDYMDV